MIQEVIERFLQGVGKELFSPWFDGEILLKMQSFTHILFLSFVTVSSLNGLLPGKNPVSSKIQGPLYYEEMS